MTTFPWAWHFHTDADVRASLHNAGFAVTAVGEEYTHEPADASTCARPGLHGFYRPDLLHLGRSPRMLWRDVLG